MLPHFPLSDLAVRWAATVGCTVWAINVTLGVYLTVDDIRSRKRRMRQFTDSLEMELWLARRSRQSMEREMEELVKRYGGGQTDD